MLSLKERALLSALSDAKTLKEVVSFCSENGSARDLCSKSKAFWMNILPRVGHRKLALTFEPLKEKYWPELIEMISKNLYKKYYYLFNEWFFEQDPEGEEALKPEIFYDALDAQEHIDLLHWELRDFHIPAITLRSNTVGWAIEMDIDECRIGKEFILSSNDGNDLPRISLISAIIFNNYLITVIPVYAEDDAYPISSYYSLVYERNNNQVEAVKRVLYAGHEGYDEYNLDKTEKIEMEYGEFFDVDILGEILQNEYQIDEESIPSIIFMNTVYLYKNLHMVELLGRDPMDLYGDRKRIVFGCYKLKMY